MLDFALELKLKQEIIFSTFVMKGKKDIVPLNMDVMVLARPFCIGLLGTNDFLLVAFLSLFFDLEVEGRGGLFSVSTCIGDVEPAAELMRS